ncbi:MAG: hypothetical protein ABI707_05275 [Ferruginibacter sp.]
MKKLFSIFAVTAIITSCSNSTDTKSGADSDSARAAATADSLAAINALDTAKKPMDTTAMPMMDTLKKPMSKSKMKKDSTKK